MPQKTEPQAVSKRPAISLDTWAVVIALGLAPCLSAWALFLGSRGRNQAVFIGGEIYGARQSSALFPRFRPSAPFTRLCGQFPGFCCSQPSEYLGKFAEQSINGYAKAHHLHVPNIEYVLWAIILGLVVSNTIGRARGLKAWRADLPISG